MCTGTRRIGPSLPMPGKFTTTCSHAAAVQSCCSRSASSWTRCSTRTPSTATHAPTGGRCLRLCSHHCRRAWPSWTHTPCLSSTHRKPQTWAPSALRSASSRCVWPYHAARLPQPPWPWVSAAKPMPRLGLMPARTWTATGSSIARRRRSVRHVLAARRSWRGSRRWTVSTATRGRTWWALNTRSRQGRVGCWPPRRW